MERRDAWKVYDLLLILPEPQMGKKLFIYIHACLENSDIHDFTKRQMTGDFVEGGKIVVDVNEKDWLEK